MKCRACSPVLLVFLINPALWGQSFAASGLVLRTDEAHRLLDVSCQAIPGYSEARVMNLSVRTREALSALNPGTLVDFKLVVEKNAKFAEQIRVHKYENSAQEPMAARQLEILEAATQPSRTEKILKPGQLVPDFTLIDQGRQTIKLAQFRGKVVALTFIYTSCPLPNFCFRMSNNFGVLHRRFIEQMDRDLVLLSITFDPEHDQPETLAEYARTWAKDTSGWHFLTGPLPEVKNICQEFGVNSWPDEGLLTHSLHTVILDRRGRVAANLEGNEYTSKQLGDLVEAVLNGTP